MKIAKSSQSSAGSSAERTDRWMAGGATAPLGPPLQRMTGSRGCIAVGFVGSRLVFNIATICEEGGQVNTGQILPSLIPTIRQLSIIGDQQQLPLYVKNLIVALRSRLRNYPGMGSSCIEMPVRSLGRGCTPTLRMWGRKLVFSDIRRRIYARRLGIRITITSFGILEAAVEAKAALDGMRAYSSLLSPHYGLAAAAMTSVHNNVREHMRCWRLVWWVRPISSSRCIWRVLAKPSGRSINSSYIRYSAGPAGPTMLC